jgi:hypothetical protein
MTFKDFRTFRAKSFTPWRRRGKRMFPGLLPFPAIEDANVDTELTELTNHIGDSAIAKRVRQLQVEYPQGTVPELVTMDWLNAGKYRYIYQGELYGGRAKSGGLLPDFVVATGGAEGMAWQVQGDYWHGSRSTEKQFSDATDNLKLIGQTVGGIRIGKVVKIWESDILKRRPQVFQMALAGISLR